MKKSLEHLHAPPPPLLAEQEPRHTPCDTDAYLQPLEDMAHACELLFHERAHLKATLSPARGVKVTPPDPYRFSQGVPLLSLEHLTGLTESWEEITLPLIHAMEMGLPAIRCDLRQLQRAIRNDGHNRNAWVAALLQGEDMVLDAVSADLGIETRTLKFILGQLLKPCLEKRVRAFKPLVEGLGWRYGYCPLCGAMPELGLIRGDGEERRLLCALCGHQWEFPKILCPCCDGEDRRGGQFLRIQGVEGQWADLCLACRRYLVWVDTSQGRRDLPFETASAGIVQLDVVAQQQGFLPAAVCPWNLVVREDTSPEAKNRQQTPADRARLH